MFGTTLVYQAGKSGIPIQELIAEKDKLTRAIPASNLVRQGRVWLPVDAEWLDEWIDEHADFPNATHDDQVDVMAYAARILVAHLSPQTQTPGNGHRRIEQELDLLAIPIG
jgi:predicted phage terminase large subunit-like protein